MKEIDTGNEKIRKICDAIKTQTIEPAKQRAEEIIENAKLEAKEIKKNAEKSRQEIFLQTEKEVQQKQNLCLSSIKSAAKQVIDQLKQELENDFFSKNLNELISGSLADPSLIAKLITAIVQSIEKEGLDVDLSAIIPQKVGAENISVLLAKDVLEKLREKKVIEGGFSGGAKVKLHDKQITIDISDEALTDLVARYIRKEFREMIFKV
jgi:V/A-type H+/Na+-transporting ATPase subunit E